jgi:hypothetical protein
VKQHAGHKIALALQDYHGFRRAQYITRKQAMPWPQLRESACCKRCQQRRQRPSAMVEYYTGVARLTQAASIPEDLTDNELDEVLNARHPLIKKEL